MSKYRKWRRNLRRLAYSSGNKRRFVRRFLRAVRRRHRRGGY